MFPTHSDFILETGPVGDPGAEAALANFLFSRGVLFVKGGPYPDDYASASGYSKGFYDLSFTATSGDHSRKLINVEVWGKFYGYVGEAYEEKRKAKESYHRDDPLFLGIPYEDCYDSERLQQCLEKFIGVITPFNFVSRHDKDFDATKWAMVDDVKAKCIRICQKLKTDHLPSEDWFCKRAKYVNRLVEDWEDVSWETLRHNIGAVGGIRVVRRLLNQGNHNRIAHSKDSILQELAAFYQTHCLAPSCIISRTVYKKSKTSLSDEEDQLLKLAAKIKAAADTHFTGKYREACALSEVLYNGVIVSKVEYQR